MVLGKDHPDLAKCYSNLASLLQTQGKYNEAESLYRRAIAIDDERAFGKGHPNLSGWYSNLALLLKFQGKYAEAEPLFRRAIEIFQSKLGPDHPTTLTAKANYDRLEKLKSQNLANPAR